MSEKVHVDPKKKKKSSRVAKPSIEPSEAGFRKVGRSEELPLLKTSRPDMDQRNTTKMPKYLDVVPDTT